MRGTTRSKYCVVPLADGGDGTAATLIENGARAVDAIVPDALGSPVRAVYARSGTTAIIEMAAASGLAALHGTCAPRAATTRGTGALITHALANGARAIVLGLGGSATDSISSRALKGLKRRFAAQHCALPIIPRCAKPQCAMRHRSFDLPPHDGPANITQVRQAKPWRNP